MEIKMKKILFIFYILLISLNAVDFFSTDVFNQQDFRKLLKEQISLGAIVEEGDGSPYPVCVLTSKELNIEMPIIKSLLKENGYQFPSKEKFYKVLKNNFSIYPKDSITTLKTGKDIDRYENDSLLGIDMVVYKHEYFISLAHCLPELINPNNFTKEIAELNKNTKINGVIMWKEYVSTEQRKINLEFLIALNKYIFNNDESQIDSLYKDNYLWWKYVNNNFLSMFLKTFLKNPRKLNFFIEQAIKNKDKNNINRWRKYKEVQDILNKKKYVIGLKRIVKINNSIYKSLYSFCKSTGIKESEIRALNPWINKKATNIPPNAEIIIPNKEEK